MTPQNIMMMANDNTIFERAEKEELDNPSVPLIDHTHPHPHPIYPSRGQPISILEASGASTLSDFGSARVLEAAAVTRGWCMPDAHRAPEILMGLPWGHQVAIWSIGVMVSACRSEDQNSNSSHHHRCLNFSRASNFSTPSTESIANTSCPWHWPSISATWALLHYR